jgi:ribosomal protein S18 acetylase RimI-like enzyme
MIVVERATEEDLIHIFEIDVDRRSTERMRWVEQAVRERRALIALEGETRLGFAVVDSQFFGEHFIDLLVVHPDARRRGIATALIRYIEKTRPTEKLFTSTNESNKIMQALLEKLGYVRSGWIDNLDEDDPEIIYFKRLER